MGEVKNAAYSGSFFKGLLSREELKGLFPQLLANVNKSNPLSLLLIKAESLCPGDLEQTPCLREDLIFLSGETAEQYLPGGAFLGRWNFEALALLLPGYSRSRALSLGEIINQAFIKRAQKSPLFSGKEYLLLSAAESAPPAGYLNLGIRAQRDLKMLGGKFFPPVKDAYGGEELLGSFLNALLNINDGYLARQGALAGEIALSLADILNLDEEIKVKLPLAARLEDLGMLLAAGESLWKPGVLNLTEWAKVKAHPRFGADLANKIGLPRQILRGILSHHEHWNGGGYPLGLLGEEIPLEGRILSFASVWAALLLPRPYRPALGEREALGLLKALGGRVLDPSLTAKAEEITASKKLLLI